MAPLSISVFPSLHCLSVWVAISVYLSIVLSVNISALASSRFCLYSLSLIHSLPVLVFFSEDFPALSVGVLVSLPLIISTASAYSYQHPILSVLHTSTTLSIYFYLLLLPQYRHSPSFYPSVVPILYSFTNYFSLLACRKVEIVYNR